MHIKRAHKYFWFDDDGDDDGHDHNVDDAIREFKQRRFCATDVKRKLAFFSFSKPWRYRIYIAKCLNSYRDDLPKNLFKITAQECKMSTSGWRASLKNVAA